MHYILHACVSTTCSNSMFLCVSVGELQKAAGHLEVFQKLAHKYRWHTDSGDSQYEMTCEHLRRVYTSIAEKVLADCCSGCTHTALLTTFHSFQLRQESVQEAITYLKKAHDMAKESMF